MTADEVAERESDNLYIRAIKKSGSGFANTYDSEAETIYTKISSSKSTEVFNCNTDASTAGAETFTFCLATKTAKTEKDGDNLVANSDFDVTLQSVEMKNVTDFAVSGVDSIYYQNSTSTTEPQATKSLTVTGKCSGVIVSIPDAKYTVIGSEHITVDNKGIKTVASTAEKDDLKGDVKETIEVVIDNAEGTSVKKEIIVSIVEPKATTVSDQKDMESSLIKDTPTVLNSLTSDAKVKDQYGVEYGVDGTISLTGARVAVDVSTVPSDWKVEFNNTTSAKITAPKAATTNDAYVTVTYTLTSGLTYTAEVHFTIGD